MHSLIDLAQIVYSLKDKDVVVFGTGESAFNATKVLTMLKIPILYYVDNCKEKQKQTFLGLIVKSPNCILEEDMSKIFVLVASMFYKDIYAQLESMGFRQGVNFFNMPYQITEKEILNHVSNFVEVYGLIEKLAPISEPKVKEKLIKALKSTESYKKDISEIILDILCKDHEIYLRNATIKFIERKSLWVLLNEILIAEDYYFESKTRRPRILDCGTNFGLAIYYFKNLYPEAEIIGFEPVKAIRDVAIHNICFNKWDNVEILPYAIDSCEKESNFWLPKSDSMAGSLTERRKQSGEDIEEIKVKCMPLSKYLKEPVNFLKLDIEGAELDVLIESQQYLYMVEYIFCEYHRGVGIEANGLSRILSILENNGFICQVNKSYSSGVGTKVRPVKYIDQYSSSIIWAKNTKFKYNV